MNSVRDEIKDAIAEALMDKSLGNSISSIYEAAADIADAVFTVLDISEADQDSPYEERLRMP